MPRSGHTDCGFSAAIKHMRWLSSAVACVVFSTLPLQARQDAQTDALRILLKALQTSVEDSATADFSAPALIQKAGLAEFANPANPTLTFVQPDAGTAAVVPAEAQSLDLRLALTMLSQAYGSDGTFNVLAAQTSPNLKALVLRKGHATMADLRRMLQDNHLQTVSPDGPLRLDVPLIIWSGATLALGIDDKIELSRANGAFIANFGHLDVNGAAIAGVGEANPLSPSFMPFVTTADGGTVQVKNAHFAHLGFASGAAFSGFSVMRGIVHVSDRQNRIENSRFDDLVSLVSDGASDIVIEGNRFSDMRGGSVVISHSTAARVRSNLFSGKMPTNAIRLQDASVGAVIEGNVVLGGKHAGILISNDSTDVRVSRNIVWHRDGGGIALTKSDCGMISENLIIDNSQKGIELRDSLGSKVEQNTILSNRSAGIWVSSQPKGAQTYLTANVLQANGSGVAGAIGESIHLSANDFTQQYPQFVSGDLGPQFKAIALDLRGTKPIVLVSSDLTQSEPPKTTCSN